MKLTIAIISKKGALDKNFVDSLLFGDEIVVVTEEKTNLSIKNPKIKVFQRPLEGNFSDQRNFAISKSSGDWIFFVDTDEVVSSQLAKEIREKINETEFSGFLIPRKDTCYHQILNHGETGKTLLLRLARKGSGVFSRKVHENWDIKGKVGEINNSLFHTKDHFISEFLDRITLYGPIDATQLNNEGKTFNLLRLLAYPKAKFLQNYIQRHGFLDGYPGIFQAYLMSVQSLSVRIFQWALANSSSV